MPTRRKPRSNHVRTGCITCKRRKVKCTEERPHCDRCVRGGFVCAGYAIPKAWVFDSRVEAQTRTKADRTESKPSDVQLTDSKSLVNQSIPSVWQSFHSLVRSPLQLGNSDPFYSYAVPIGPRENYLLTVYQDLVAPHICGSRHKNSTNIGRVYLECLKNEATACALFARNSAVEGLILRGRHAKPSAFYIGYANRSYAVLRHRLSLMDGSETAATVRAMIQSTCLLAVAAMFTDFTTTEVHLRAMGKLVVRYAELIGGHAGKEPTLITTYIEIIRAYATLPRPTITMQGWFLRLAQDIQDSTTVSQKDARINNSDPTIVHADAQDKSLGDITVSWREEIGGYHGISQDRKLSRGEAELHKTAGFSESVFQHSLSLGALLNALERLKSSGMNSEQAQHDSIRVSMALSELIWVQVTSPTTVFTDILFNLTPSLLRQVKGIIKRDVCVRNRLLGHEEAYTNGQLWAILVASFLQLHGKAIQGSDLVCGDCVTIMQQSAASRT